MTSCFNCPRLHDPKAEQYDGAFVSAEPVTAAPLPTRHVSQTKQESQAIWKYSDVETRDVQRIEGTAAEELMVWRAEASSRYESVLRKTDHHQPDRLLSTALPGQWTPDSNRSDTSPQPARASAQSPEPVAPDTPTLWKLDPADCYRPRTPDQVPEYAADSVNYDTSDEYPSRPLWRPTSSSSFCERATSPHHLLRELVQIGGHRTCTPPLFDCDVSPGPVFKDPKPTAPPNRRGVAKLLDLMPDPEHDDVLPPSRNSPAESLRNDKPHEVCETYRYNHNVRNSFLRRSDNGIPQLHPTLLRATITTHADLPFDDSEHLRKIVYGYMPVKRRVPQAERTRDPAARIAEHRPRHIRAKSDGLALTKTSPVRGTASSKAVKRHTLPRRRQKKVSGYELSDLAGDIAYGAWHDESGKDEKGVL